MSVATIPGFIHKKSVEELAKVINISNINASIGSTNVTPLWFAINGKTKRPDESTPEFADYEIIKLLVDEGANTNKKSVMSTPLYWAVFHERSDITRLLLMNDANPNEYNFIRMYNKKVLCEVPLNVAIRNMNLTLVNLLVIYGALYNKYTIDKVAEGINKLKRHKKTTKEEYIYNRLKSIYNILKNNYKEENESKVIELMNKQKKTGTFYNYYTCFHSEENVNAMIELSIPEKVANQEGKPGKCGQLGPEFTVA